MACPNLIELQSYFDHELSPGKMHQITRHLEKCSTCRNQIAEWGQLVNRMQSEFPMVTVPRDNQVIRVRSKRLIGAVAVLALAVSLPAIWYWSDFRIHHEFSQNSSESELLEQYFILYGEESETIGGNDV